MTPGDDASEDGSDPRRTGRRGYLALSGAAIAGGIGVLSVTSRTASAGTSTIRIAGPGAEGGAVYEFTASGSVRPRSSANGADEATGNGASGTVSGWYDEYEFEGEITSFTSAGPLTVAVDGVTVDPDRWPSSAPERDVVVSNRGSDDVVEYEFEATGTVANTDAGDTVSESTASGVVDGWFDAYHFDGDLAEFVCDGPVTVFVDGTRADPLGVGAATDGVPEASIRKRGRVHPLAPGGGYADVAVDPEGRYAAVGTYLGADGTVLVDLRDPAAPTTVHHVPADAALATDGGPVDAGTVRHTEGGGSGHGSGGSEHHTGDSGHGSEVAPPRNVDVKFDPRGGLYYRTRNGTGAPNGVEAVDYGFGDGAPDDPAVFEVFTGSAHNLFPHPSEPVVYTTNYDADPETAGFDVWGVRDPADATRIGSVGPSGACHDVTVDPGRDLLHCAYQGGSSDLDGYVVMDASDPRSPTEVGRFDYADEPGYGAVGVGGEAFGGGHHAEHDPRRDLVVVGDERSYGPPGGKHVFDIGWGEGTPADPRPVGYTVSPNARRMESDPDGDGETEARERFDWTGHDFDVVPAGGRTYLVGGDYSDGVVLYDVTDPTAPTAVDQYWTTDGDPEPNDRLARRGEPPRVWNAEYRRADGRDLVVASDQFTGVYTFELSLDRGV